jgi:hypothetical protein
VLYYTDPFMSEVDIDAGDRGLVVLSEQLAETDFGIVCVTPENQHEPWINFEAGALGKSIERGRVVPFLLGMHVPDLRQPLAQFQAKEADLDGTRALVASINSVAATPLPMERLPDSVEVWWPRLQRALAEAETLTHPETAGPQLPEKVDEILIGVRGLQQQLDRLARPSEGGARGFRDALDKLLSQQHGVYLGPLRQVLRAHGYDVRRIGRVPDASLRDVTEPVAESLEPPPPVVDPEQQ